jgi:hypothetical protein
LFRIHRIKHTTTYANNAPHINLYAVAIWSMLVTITTVNWVFFGGQRRKN